MTYAVKTNWIQCDAAVVVIKDITNSITTVLPTISARYRIIKGTDVVKLLTGGAAPANDVPGTAIGQLQMSLGAIPGVTNAVWFNNAYTLDETNTSANYHQVTIYRYPADAAPINFMACKYDTYQLRAMFDMTGANNMLVQNIGLWSADPKDGTALTYPGSEPTAALLAYGNSDFTGATQVAQYDLSLSRNLRPIPETDNTGLNTDLPYLCGGLKQGQLIGQVVLKQSALAATIPGHSGAEAALTAAFGASSAGISIATNMVHFSEDGNVDLGFSFSQNTYKLLSTDGTNPTMVAWTDL